VEKYSRIRQATDDNMRFACWTTKATDTHSEYAILLGFPRQHWLRERASMLTFISSLPVLLPVTFTVLSRNVASSREEVGVQYILLLPATLLRHKSASFE
jgi:hypothetical protein